MRGVDATEADVREEDAREGNGREEDVRYVIVEKAKSPVEKCFAKAALTVVRSDERLVRRDDICER